MRKILIVVFALIAVQGAFAQSAKRRAEQAEAQARKSNQNQLSTRAQISFPTQAEMQEDVVWRRDVYREINLTQDANAGLYYPVEPQGSQMNLFTYLFKLMLRGQIKAYDYDVNTGDARFDESLRVKPLEFLKKYEIYYERTDRGLHIDDADIPSREVKAYFIKESSYYDQNTATFHTKVLALCPVMVRDDDFGDGGTKYPLFWVKYDDIAPFLARQTIMTSNLNNAATMSVDDYFTMNRYKGKIYKTNNMQGTTLPQDNDTLRTKAQNKIEQEILAFEKNMWGNQARKDSLDSIANLDKKELKKARKANRRSGGSSSTVKRTRRSKSPSGSANSSARVTVRRQRH
ncbi:MAG: gliding motility protein GldN [Prevotella sp.]